MKLWLRFSLIITLKSNILKKTIRKVVIHVLSGMQLGTENNEIKNDNFIAQWQPCVDSEPVRDKWPDTDTDKHPPPG
jgi:hypothetical protein